MNNNFNEAEFKSLLINRNEIEKALDIAINLNQAIDSEEPFLDDYSMVEYIPIETVIAIFLNLPINNSRRIRTHPRYSTIYRAIEQKVRRDRDVLDVKIEDDFDNGYEIRFDIFLSHSFARAWAKTHGLNWNIPPYKELAYYSSNNIQVEQLQAQLQQAQTQIEQLKQENKQLLNQKQGEVDYEDYSIYGHTSEEIKIMFKTIDRFWKNCDLNQPDTIANKEIIIDWIISTYGKNKSTAERIQTLIRPEKARETGRKS